MREMVQAVFRDSETQRQFDAAGYIHLRGFLSAAEVEALKAAYFELKPESGGAMSGDETDFKNNNEITYDFTFIDRNWEYKQKVFDRIAAAFEAHYEPILADYTPIIANFIHKGESGGEVPLHQNWAFVDEMKYTSVSVWVPLVDSTQENGTLEIAPGSHKRFGRFRGPMVPWELDKIKEDIIHDFMVPMEATAGDAVILDDSVIHYSNINQTKGLRLTIQLILVPKNTISIHYHLDRAANPNEVRILEVDHDFYMKFHPWKRPEGKEIGTRPFFPRYLSRADFEARLHGPEFTEMPDTDMQPEPQLVSAHVTEAAQQTIPEKSSIFSRIKRIFS